MRARRACSRQHGLVLKSRTAACGDRFWATGSRQASGECLAQRKSPSAGSFSRCHGEKGSAKRSATKARARELKSRGPVNWPCECSGSAYGRDDITAHCATPWSTGNGLCSICDDACDGRRIVPPRWPHFVQRGFFLRASLEAPTPHRMMNGASGTATLRPQASQYHHTQCCAALSWPRVGIGGGGLRAMPDETTGWQEEQSLPGCVHREPPWQAARIGIGSNGVGS